MGTEPPLPIVLLEEHIKDWQMVPPSIIASLKQGSFDKLIMQPRFAFLSGENLAWDFIAVATIVPPEKMNEDAANLYRSLKLCECQLEWRGLLKKTPSFKPFEGLVRLIKGGGIAQGLEPSPEIASLLSSSTPLRKALERSRPTNLIVTLFSRPPTSTKISSTDEKWTPSQDVLIKDAIEFYQRPSEITYVVLAIKSFVISIERLDRTKCKATFTQIFDALSETAKILKDFSLLKLKTGPKAA